MMKRASILIALSTLISTIASTPTYGYPPSHYPYACLSHARVECNIISINDCNPGALNCLDLTGFLNSLERKGYTSKVLPPTPCNLNSSHCTSGTISPEHDCAAGEEMKLVLCDELSNNGRVREKRASNGEFFKCGAQTCVAPSMCCGAEVGCQSPPYGCPPGTDITGPPSMVDFVPQKPQDKDMVCDMFNERDKDVILRIPLSSNMNDDGWFWYREARGLFSVKSYYRAIYGEFQQNDSED